MAMLHHPSTSKWKQLAETYLRDLTFGVEDGIVSSFGVLIGVAIGAKSSHMVQLTGLVVIAVEALSMAVGTFLSARSEKERVAKILSEELDEIRTNPEKERAELVVFYTNQGFSPEAAATMVVGVYPQLFARIGEARIPWTAGARIPIASAPARNGFYKKIYSPIGREKPSPTCCRINSASPASIPETWANL